jgi:hypothetical protein
MSAISVLLQLLAGALSLLANYDLFLHLLQKQIICSESLRNRSFVLANRSFVLAKTNHLFLMIKKQIKQKIDL